MKIVNEELNKSWEDRVRKQCEEIGFTLHKGTGPINKNNKGLYKIVATANTGYIYGYCYDATLDEIEEYLDELVTPKTLNGKLVQELKEVAYGSDYPADVFDEIIEALEEMDPETSDFFLAVKTWCGPIDEEAEYIEGLEFVSHNLLTLCYEHGVRKGFNEYLAHQYNTQEELNNTNWREVLEDLRKISRNPAQVKSASKGLNRPN